MNPGTDVREVVTGKAGVIISGSNGPHDWSVLFPSIRGHLNLDGTIDNGLRRIPRRLLQAFKPSTQAVMESIANVLQTEG